MAGKPEWADSEKPKSPDGTLEMVKKLIAATERLTFTDYLQTNKIIGEYFTLNGGYDYVIAPTLEEVIIKLQEKLL